MTKDCILTCSLSPDSLFPERTSVLLNCVETAVSVYLTLHI